MERYVNLSVLDMVWNETEVEKIVYSKEYEGLNIAEDGTAIFPGELGLLEQTDF